MSTSTSEKCISEYTTKEIIIHILSFLKDQLLEKNETIENSIGCDFTSSLWGEYFNFDQNIQPSESVITTGDDVYSFLTKYYVVKNNKELFVCCQTIGKILQLAILHKYIRAEFTEDSQKIFLTEKGLDRIELLK